jgi:hypothetical protein
MRRWPIVTLFAITAVTSLAAQIRAGTAKTSITPHSQMRLAGYSNRDHSAGTIPKDIFARALAIDDGSGGRAVILSVELLAVPRLLAERVAADIMKAHGLERGQIVISASGTHSAPFVQGLLPVLAPAGIGEQREIAEYSAGVSRALFDVASAALANMQPARVSFSSGHATFALNEPPRAVVDGPGSGSTVDVTVPVLRIATSKGDTLAVVFSSTLGGDYAGIAAAAIESGFPGTVALFLQSCDGGQSTVSIELAPSHGAALAAEVARVLSLPMPAVVGRLRATLIETSLPFAPHTREQFEAESESGDPALARRARLLLAAYDARTEPRQMPYSVQVIHFAKGFALVALAGQPAAAYGLRIRELLGQPDLMIAGGANDGGYFVPESGIEDFGDAGRLDSIVNSGFPGAFTDEAQERILTTVERAWKRVAK